jgi:hypothetical protein
MTLLAHLFSIAMSNLFIELSVPFHVRTNFGQPYTMKMVPLNGSGPVFVPDQRGALEAFNVAVSNATANTPMPPWTDEEWFYLPFSSESADNLSVRQASTPALRGSLDCLMPDFNLSISGQGNDAGALLYNASQANFTATLVNGNRTVTCKSRFTLQDGMDLLIGNGYSGRSAFEFVLAMGGLSDSSLEDQRFCMEHISAGWVRADLLLRNTSSDGSPIFDILAYNSTVITCRTKIQLGMANVAVDRSGTVLNRNSISNISDQVDGVFSTTTSDFLGQMQYFTQSNSGRVTWHNDSFPSDFNNYLLQLAMNTSQFLDSKSPVPHFNDMTEPFAAQYSKLIAITLARNKDTLLIPNSNQTRSIEGDIILPQIRIFLSKSLFIIAEIILLFYFTVAITLFLRRPWRILVRMPTTLASVIAFFAASHAVEDFKSEVVPDKRGVNQMKSDIKYGFGSFVGTDDAVHVGIEKHPFLAGLKKSNTSLTWRSGNSNKDSSKNQRWKIFELESSKVKEGGWL